MQLSPIQIEGYYIRSLSFSLRCADDDLRFVMQPGFHVLPQMSEAAEYNAAVDANFKAGRSSTEPLRWRFEGVIESVDDRVSNHPYKFHISLVGFFNLNEHFAAGKSDEELAHTMRLGASNILYSVAREALATATARSPFPALVLPAVSMLQPEAKEADDSGEVQSSEATSEVRKRSARKRSARKTANRTPVK